MCGRPNLLNFCISLLQMETDAAFQNHSSCAPAAVTASPPSAVATTSNHNTAEDSCTDGGTQELATDEAHESGRVSDRAKHEKKEEEMDEDDLPTEQTFQTAERHTKPPPAILREIDKDGNETVISDHSTSVTFTFQNTLMYELD